jgi:hypothetical protein
MNKWEREAKEWRSLKRYEWELQKAAELYDTIFFFWLVFEVLLLFMVATISF